jgi:hypothetical protein
MRLLLFAIPKLYRHECAYGAVGMVCNWLFINLFFSGLREASPQAQYALAFIRFS